MLLIGNSLKRKTKTRKSKKFLCYAITKFSISAYFRTGKMQKIDPFEVELKIRPLILRAKEKS
jgi:hypothetical protein